MNYLNLELLFESNKELPVHVTLQHLVWYRMSRSPNDRFLYRIVIGDEKWCRLYVNEPEIKMDGSKGEAKTQDLTRSAMVAM